MKEKEYVTVRISKDLHTKISLLAVKNHETITDLLIRLINEVLKKKKAEQ